jgi:peptide/nickel transport system permease protein
MIEFRSFKKNKLFMIGVGMSGMIILCGIFAPWIATHGMTEGTLQYRLKPPSTDHLFGTDQLGRDVFSRVIHGTRLSLLSGSMVVLISAVIGVSLGVLAGYRGGIIDNFLMRLTDLILAFPSFLLAMLVVTILGLGLKNAVLAVAIAYIGPLSRLARGTTIKLKGFEFVEAARAVGGGPWHNILVHILPNIISSILIQMALNFGAAIVDIAGLSFLGLGAQPPQPEWGAMLSSGRYYVQTAWWLCTFPGLAIMFLVLACVFVGDGFREILDPKHG